MDDARYLRDRTALMDVMLRYGQAVDERDMGLFASLFAEDVEVHGFGAEAIRGRDAWVAFVADALAGYGPTQHMMGPQLATIDGDAAHCRSDTQAVYLFDDAPGKTLTLWVTYVTDMARVDGGWRIVRHELQARGRRVQEGT